MKQTPIFVAPVLGSTQSKVNKELFEQSVERYGEGKHLEAFHLLLDHLNPEFRTKYGNADGTEFSIPHGSILVNIRDRRRTNAHQRRFPGNPREGPAWRGCGRSPT